LLVAMLAAITAAVGLFSTGGPGQFAFRTVRGETVQMFGQGIYHYDTLFQGAIFRGSDAIVLFLGVPILLVSIALYRRGSLRGSLVLLSTLAYFLYTYASLALGAAYNDLFLVYVALFSASLIAFVLLLTSIAPTSLAASFARALPRRKLAIFMLMAGAVTLLVWLSDVLPGLFGGDLPKHLDSYTTPVTYTLDLGIITPLCFLAGALLWRDEPLGYLIAAPLLGIVVLLAPTIVGQTVSQLAAGVTLTPSEVVGPTAGFVVLGLAAARFLARLLRAVPGSRSPARGS
jgi:hypothetical protein